MSTDYAEPPVQEAVIGVEFAPLQISLVHLARVASLWEDELPLAQDAPALAPVVPATAPAPSFSLEMTQGVSPTRYLFASSDQAYLLQVQNDRFLLNWRKMTADAQYPRYAELRERFDRLFAKFIGFTTALGLSELSIRSTEHTYFNKIVGRPAAGDMLVNFRKSPEELPGTALFMRYAEVRALSLEKYGAVGEISFTCDPIHDEPKPAVQLAITTRFFTGALGTSGESLSKLLDSGHSVSKEGFERFTTSDKQKEWGKK